MLLIMCYDKETSIKTYVIGVILSLCLFYNGDKYDKHIAIFSFVFIQIQLIEFFMWMDQDCGKINHYATIFAHIITMLHPVSILLGGMIYNNYNMSKNILNILIILSIIPLIFSIIKYIRSNQKL